MRRFAADGMDAACLGVDTENPSGALSLYERLGYRPTASTCVHELVEEPGASSCPVLAVSAIEQDDLGPGHPRRAVVVGDEDGDPVGAAGLDLVHDAR